MLKPRQDLKPNTAAYETQALVKPTGFREYDARWILEKEINLLGIQALGLGLATYVHEIGIAPKIVTGHDFRGYSLSVKQALILPQGAVGTMLGDEPIISQTPDGAVFVAASSGPAARNSSRR